jgi:hypothetical protein
MRRQKNGSHKIDDILKVRISENGNISPDCVSRTATDNSNNGLTLPAVRNKGLELIKGIGEGQFSKSTKQFGKICRALSSLVSDSI